MLYGFEKYAEAKEWFFRDCPECHDNCECRVERGYETEDIDAEERYEVFQVVCDACGCAGEVGSDEGEAVFFWNNMDEEKVLKERDDSFKSIGPNAHSDLEDYRDWYDAIRYEREESLGKARAKGEEGGYSHIPLWVVGMN